jgi:hypothetical protein
MGKKYIPVQLHSLSYKVYLDSLVKIYKCTRKPSIPPPAFAPKGVSRKASIDTTNDDELEVCSKSELI